MSNSLTKASYYDGLASYPAEHCVRILNPLSNDLSVMRQTLLFNALEAVQLNVNHRNADLKLYEYGNCYFYDPAKKEEGGTGSVLRAGQGVDDRHGKRPSALVERRRAARRLLHAASHGGKGDAAHSDWT